MSEPKDSERKVKDGKPFVYRFSREKLMEFKNVSTEAKLQWLEEANAFVNLFVGDQKRSRWKAFVGLQEVQVKKRDDR